MIPVPFSDDAPRDAAAASAAAAISPCQLELLDAAGPGTGAPRGQSAGTQDIEAARLHALWRYRILDTTPEVAYDDIVLLASTICEAPIALVSLIDADRQWFKSRVGLNVQETSRDVAFCAHALHGGAGMLEIPDALEDPRFDANPLVTGEPHIRFYAGVPLVATGNHVLGTLCVIDRVPRQLTARQRACLEALARQVVGHIEQRLQTLTDGLTHLPNRAAMLALIEAAVARTRRVEGYRFAVLSIDIDRFKAVNDNFGHGVGDAFLCQVAERIERAVRPGDTVARTVGHGHVAGRMGGDEFVVLLDGVGSAEEACGVAERLLVTLSEPYGVGGVNLRSAGSIGIALPGDRPFDADTVLREADVAMYEAKRAGRGTAVVFAEGMEFRMPERMSMERDLRDALAGGELYVAYQPIVELATGRWVAMEALARWKHPNRGQVAPLDFIGVAEESGLIDTLGEWVLDAGCARFMAWQGLLGAAAPRRLCVNVSRAQMEHAGFDARVIATLARHGMAADALELEVTESLAGQGGVVRATLTALRACGVSIALDDFGTGYSSLASVGQLPLDSIKIDRSLVSGEGGREAPRALVEATVALARAMGLPCVAEGVETQSQAQMLTDMGCSHAQGYWFGRPMTEPDCSLRLSAHNGSLAAP